MDITDHGEWVRYEPDNYPIKGLPSHVLFARRVSDGMDWYQFQRSELTAADTVKMLLVKTDEGWAVITTNHDATHLFPAGARLIEVRGVDRDHESYRMNFVDLDKKRFLPPLHDQPSMMSIIIEELGLDEAKLKAKLDAALKNRRRHG